MQPVCYFNVDEYGRLPERMSSGAAGYDIFSGESLELEPNSSEIINTGVRMIIPEGYYGHICSKSSLAGKYNVHVGAGVIDSDYRGYIKVLLNNRSSTPYIIFTGEPIAQIIFKQYEVFRFRYLHSENFNSYYTDRGNKGFGQMTDIFNKQDLR